MRSSRCWNSLAAALLVVLAAGCAESPADLDGAGRYRPQLAVVPGPAVIDFEGLENFEEITDEFADRGVLFGMAAAIDTSQLAIGLFEPRSGIGVAFNCIDSGCGALGASFPDGAIAAGAFVTGFAAVTLTCFDAADAPLGSASTPGRNVIGNPDGLPVNIHLEVAAAGIARCEFESATQFVIDDFTFTPEPQEVLVLIDVKQSSVNLKSRGVLPVVLLGDAGFDPVTDVNLITLTLGDGSEKDTPLARRRNGTFRASGGDRDGDGHRDLMLHFSTRSLVANDDLTGASTQLVLRGATKGGVAFRGADDVRVVP